MKKYLIISMCFFCSCNSFLQLDTPRHELSAAAVFQNDEAADGAMAGIYAALRNNRDNYFSSGGNSSITRLGSILSDEMVYHGTNVNSQAFYAGDILPDNIFVYNLWESLYKTIYAANAVAEGVEGNGALTPALADRLLGEALFLRSFAHFYLVNLFGEIPLVLTTDYQKNRVLRRSPVDVIYRQMVTDLEKARILLPDDYGHANNERVRANKWVAAALLARVCLYQEDWSGAEKYATELIANTTLFSITDQPGEVFLKNNQEAIWQLFIPAGQAGETYEMFGNVIPVTNQIAPPDFAFSAAIQAAFEEGDQRLSLWTGQFIPRNSDTPYRYPYKYKVVSSPAGTAKKEYSTVLRLAEQYLLRAEARLALGNIAGCRDDLNVIRSNHGHLPETLTNDTGELSEHLRRERQAEFFYEWGHRWLDRKRWGIETGTNRLLPVPEKELLANPFLLPQNPGY